MTYFDYAANAPVDIEVLDTFYDVTKTYFANPNSYHQLGVECKKVLDASTHHIASLLECEDDEIIYTSGATESNNLAIKGLVNRYKNKGKHILIGSLEHNSITECVTHLPTDYEVELIPLTKEGLVDIEEFKNMLRDDTLLVSLCAIDSELAIRQPIEEIGKILKDKKTYFHVDASQAIGKVDINYHDVDLLTLTPHKFYGINGTGALIKRKGVSLRPLIEGGKSTTIFRSGTPVIGNIVAFDKALTIALDKQEERVEKITQYHDELVDFLSQYKDVHINTTKYSLPHIINFSILGSKSLQFSDLLQEKGIYLSTKTSCCPVNTPSKLVYALTRNKALASSSLRLSLSHLNTQEDIETFKTAFDTIYKEINHG